MCKVNRPAPGLFFVLKKCGDNVLWEEDEEVRYINAKGKKRHQEV